MRPGRAFGHEAAEEQRGGHRAGHRPVRHVAEIGDVGAQHLVIAVPQRHPPQRIADRLAAAEHVVGERVVIGEQSGQIRPERDPGGAGQGGEIEDQLGLLLAGAGERVAEDQAAFRIGIADLDGEALAALQDIAGPEGGARYGILDRRDQQMQPHRQLQRP